MPAIITNKFRIHNAEQFSESFSEASPNVYYMMLGRPQAFATSTRGDSRTDNEGSDSSPITPADSISREFFDFDDAIAAKKIATSDVSFAIIKFGLLNLNPTIRLVLIKDVLFKKFLLLVLLFIFTSPLNFQLF